MAWARIHEMIEKSLSVIIPNYNHGAYIGEQLESILVQSFKPREVIVVDDASTDNSVDVIECFVRRTPIVRLLRNPSNIDPHASLNRGLEVASGEFVFMPAANNTTLPGFFEKCMNLLAQHSEAGLCHTDYATLDGRSLRHYLGDESRFLTPEEVAGAIRRRRCLFAGGGNSIVKRSALVEAGGLRPKLRWNADSFSLLVVALRCGLCYIPQSLVAFRVEANSWGRRGRRHWYAQREALMTLLDILGSEAYSDIRTRVRAADAWPLSELPMIRLLISERRHQSYLTARLMRRALTYAAWDLAKRVAPIRAQQLYCQFSDRIHTVNR